MTDFAPLVVLVDPTYEPEPDPETQVLERSVTLSNEQWDALRMCTEAYAGTLRTQQSELIATYVTRNQLDQAVAAAQRMNDRLQLLDKLQALLS
jgi:hypothetical protein